MKPLPLLLPLAALALAGAASADLIPVANTGRTLAGGVLAAGAAQSAYVVTRPDASAGSAVVLSSGSRYPDWVASADSDWIGNADAVAPGPTGTYRFTQSFSLAGLDPATARLAGEWSGDDEGRGIFLNGVLVPGSALTSGTPWTAFGGFSITSGFIPGVNTLAFEIVSTDDFYEGVNVRFTERSARPVPEPASLAALALGGGALLRRRPRRLSSRRS